MRANGEIGNTIAGVNVPAAKEIDGNLPLMKQADILPWGITCKSTSSVLSYHPWQGLTWLTTILNTAWSETCTKPIKTTGDRCASNATFQRHQSDNARVSLF